LLSREALMPRLAKQFVMLLVCAMLVVLAAFAQDTSSQGPDTSGKGSTSTQESNGAAPAATGIDTTMQLSENPPLSGLDEPSFEPGFGTRSYLAPSAQVSEALDSNASGNIGNSNISEDTRILGSVELQKLWKIHPLNIDYIGGIDGYKGNGANFYQVHSLVATQRILWRTGQLAFRDSFTYLPEGTFGFSSFGGVGGFNAGGATGSGVTGGGIAGGGGTGIFTNGQFGSIGNEPRITNISIADVTQYLSPRSSVVISGAYEWTDFLNNPLGYINSQATIVQAGYNYQISKHDQVAFTYAFDEMHFPGAPGGSANTNALQVMYGHLISGRLTLRLAAGPQWVHIHEEIPILIFLVPVNNSFVNASGRASLLYHISSRSNVHLSYMHFIDAGSGFFAGAKTDAVTFGVGQSLTRHWIGTAEAGYSRNSRLLSTTTAVAGNADNYSYWFAGATLRRHLSPHFSVFASYQYNRFGAASGFCSATAPNCGRRYGRQIGLVGLTWTPRPIRLD
jgi:hypothetical protein